MMKLLKWVGIVLGSVVGLALIAVVIISSRGGARLNKVYSVDAEAIQVPSDSAAIARGEHLVNAVALCASCHGPKLEGQLMFDEPPIATIYASNLTSGKGGIASSYSDTDFVRAIRHGVNRNGRGMMIMHSDAYHNFSASDLASVIAYVKSLPPVDNEVPTVRTAFFGKILVAMGAFDTPTVPLIPAEVIDHSAPFAPEVPADSSVGYGAYLTSIALCTQCHGADLKGAPSLEPDGPPSPNIAIYGTPGVYTREQFIGTIRSGVSPGGRALNPELMPWDKFAKMTDLELTAIWRHIASQNGG